MKPTAPVLLALAMLLPAGSVLAAGQPMPPRTAPAVTYGTARALPAWVTFCKGYPEECAVGEGDPERITLDKATWDRIVSVNRSVNNSVAPLPDDEHWGVADRWDLAEDGKGDCEDYALRKRHILAQAGLPRRAMRMTVVIDERREGHAVLVLLTDRGDLVLDNKTRSIDSWRATGYEFVKRESADGRSWVSLRPSTPPADVPVATLNQPGKP